MRSLLINSCTKPWWGTNHDDFGLAWVQIDGISGISVMVGDLPSVSGLPAILACQRYFFSKLRASSRHACSSISGINVINCATPNDIPDFWDQVGRSTCRCAIFLTSWMCTPPMHLQYNEFMWIQMNSRQRKKLKHQRFSSLNFSWIHLNFIPVIHILLLPVVYSSRRKAPD